MKIRNEHTAYLGRTAQREPVWGTLALTDQSENPRGPRTMTDHSVIPAGEVFWGVSTMYTLGTPGYGVSFDDLKLSSMDGPGADRYWARGGQVPAQDRVIVDRARYLTPETLALFASADDWHLNDMRAACDHMTEAMLNPDKDTLSEYIAQNPGSARYGRQDALTKYRLDRVTCPETGYRWGHAWLSKALPAELLSAAAEFVGVTL